MVAIALIDGNLRRQVTENIPAQAPDFFFVDIQNRDIGDFTKLVSGIVPDGKLTDFRRAVQAKDGETVVFGWIEWPDKPTRDAGMAALMQDPRMRATRPVWNGQLAIFGGFAPVLDTNQA